MAMFGCQSCCAREDAEEITAEVKPIDKPESVGFTEMPELVTPAAAAVNISKAQGLDEYVITIEKRPPSDVDLGMDCDWADKRTLHIDGIREGKLIHQWNLKNTDRQVKPGDRMIKVNDIAGDASAIIAKCKEANTLNITFRRPSAGAGGA